VEGPFRKGDVVSIRDPDDAEVARGLTNYSSEDAAGVVGKPADRGASGSVRGPYAELVHRDNLVVIR
jgi:glutamate 5-kinase